MERIDRERPAQGLHARAHADDPRPLRAGPGADAVVDDSDDKLAAQADGLRPDGDLDALDYPCPLLHHQRIIKHPHDCSNVRFPLKQPKIIKGSTKGITIHK